MNFSSSIDRAIEILATWLIVWLAYGLLILILSFWMDSKKSKNTFGILISIALCIIGSMMCAIIIGFSFKSINSGLTAFIVMLVCSAAALHTSYKEQE